MPLALAFHTIDPGLPSANGGIYDKIISFISHSPLVHVELAWLPEGWTKSTSKSATQCFSSVPGDGCRFTSIPLAGPEWKVTPLPGLDPAAAHTLASHYLGEKYDWIGILGFAFPWGAHDDEDKFCSEVCASILQQLGFLPPDLKTFRISPAKLAALVDAQLAWPIRP